MTALPDAVPLRRSSRPLRQYLRGIAFPPGSVAGGSSTSVCPDARCLAIPLRPSLVLWACAAGNGELADALPVSAAFDLFDHFFCCTTSSPTVPRSTVERWGLGQSLNAGDALYATRVSQPCKHACRSRIGAYNGGASSARPCSRRSRYATRSARNAVLTRAALQAGAVIARGAPKTMVVAFAKAGRSWNADPAAAVATAACRSSLPRISPVFEEVARYVADERHKDATPSRKAEHLRINIERDVAAKGIDTRVSTHIGFEHRALPEIDFAEVDPSAELFGRRLASPLLISCMTGGTPEARAINRRLARGRAETLASRWDSVRDARCSNRPSRSRPSTCAPTRRTYCSSQTSARFSSTRVTAIDECRRLVELVAAPTRSCCISIRCKKRCSPKATRASAACSQRIARSARALAFPIVVKEVGWGIARERRARALRRRRCGGRRCRRGRDLVERSRAPSHRRALARARRRGVRAVGEFPTARVLVEARARRAGGDVDRQRRRFATASTSRKPSRSAPISPASRGRSCARPTRAPTPPITRARADRNACASRCFCTGARTPRDLRSTLDQRGLSPLD